MSLVSSPGDPFKNPNTPRGGGHGLRKKTRSLLAEFSPASAFSSDQRQERRRLVLSLDSSSASLRSTSQSSSFSLCSIVSPRLLQRGGASFALPEGRKGYGERERRGEKEGKGGDLVPASSSIHCADDITANPGRSFFRRGHSTQHHVLSCRAPTIPDHGADLRASSLSCVPSPSSSGSSTHSDVHVATPNMSRSTEILQQGASSESHAGRGARCSSSSAVGSSCLSSSAASVLLKASHHPHPFHSRDNSRVVIDKEKALSDILLHSSPLPDRHSPCAVFYPHRSPVGKAADSFPLSSSHCALAVSSCSDPLPLSQKSAPDRNEETVKKLGAAGGEEGTSRNGLSLKSLEDSAVDHMVSTSPRLARAHVTAPVSSDQARELRCPSASSLASSSIRGEKSTDAARCVSLVMSQDKGGQEEEKQGKPGVEGEDERKKITTLVDGEKEKKECWRKPGRQRVEEDPPHLEEDREEKEQQENVNEEEKEEQRVSQDTMGCSAKRHCEKDHRLLSSSSSVRGTHFTGREGALGSPSEEKNKEGGGDLREKKPARKTARAQKRDNVECFSRRMTDSKHVEPRQEKEKKKGDDGKNKGEKRVLPDDQEENICVYLQSLVRTLAPRHQLTVSLNESVSFFLSAESQVVLCQISFISCGGKDNLPPGCRVDSECRGRRQMGREREEKVSLLSLFPSGGRKVGMHPKEDVCTQIQMCLY